MINRNFEGVRSKEFKTGDVWECDLELTVATPSA